MLQGNWAMCLDILSAMGLGQACVCSDYQQHAGRTALHMAVFVKPKDTAEEVYQEFLVELVRKATILI